MMLFERYGCEYYNNFLVGNGTIAIRLSTISVSDFLDECGRSRIWKRSMAMVVIAKREQVGGRPKTRIV